MVSSVLKAMKVVAGVYVFLMSALELSDDAPTSDDFLRLLFFLTAAVILLWRPKRARRKFYEPFNR